LLEVKTARPDNVHLIYHFHGNELEGKPTFYDNNLIPEGWRITNKETLNQEQVFSIRNATQKAKITISYTINGKQIATARQFKKERLKKALTGQGTTSLQWHFKQE